MTVPDHWIPDELGVHGTLKLDDADKTQLREYIEHLLDLGQSVATAAETSLLQIAQDRLGHTGFAVGEIEPL